MLARAYTATALIVLNTLVAFLVVNLVLGGVLAARWALGALRTWSAPEEPFTSDGAPVDNGRRSSFQIATFDALAYPDLPPAAVAEILDDFHALAQRGMLYQPWVQFGEPPHQGRRVTVLADELGLPMRRTTDTATAGRAVRIYVFGGSTTFGYNVADEHTWPSALARELNARGAGPVEVRNYGRGFYYPSQELALFVDLLRSGHRPALAIFMDGLNVGFDQDVPHYSRQVTNAMEARQHARDWATVRSLQLPWFPLWRVMRRLLQSSPVEERVEPPADVDALAAMLALRFEANRRLAERIGSLHGVRVLHILQPNALVDYPPDLYRTPPGPRFRQARRLASALYTRLRGQDGIVDLSGLLLEWGRRKAVVDHVHYNPGFGAFLAARVAQHVRLEQLAATPSALDAGAQTGEARTGKPVSPLL